jgi:hypothetical protein
MEINTGVISSPKEDRQRINKQTYTHRNTQTLAHGCVDRDAHRFNCLKPICESSTSGRVHCGKCVWELVRVCVFVCHVCCGCINLWGGGTGAGVSEECVREGVCVISVPVRAFPVSEPACLCVGLSERSSGCVPCVSVSLESAGHRYVSVSLGLVCWTRGREARRVNLALSRRACSLNIRSSK